MADFSNNPLTIMRMVYNRLPSLTVNEDNSKLIADFVWELMNDLESCFKVGIVPSDEGYNDNYNTSYLQQGDYYGLRVGKEENYSVVQKAIIADLTAAYILVTLAAGNSQGATGSTGAKFLKKAKAGSAETEWGEFDIKKTGLMNSETLIEMYNKRASIKAASLGCILDICNTCVLGDAALPFIVVKSCGC